MGKEINGQIFTNSRVYATTYHPSRSFYNKLKNYYCKQKGFKMCDAWLDFQNFAIFWDLHDLTNKNIRLNQSFKEISKDSIMILANNNKQVYNSKYKDRLC